MYEHTLREIVFTAVESATAPLLTEVEGPRREVATLVAREGDRLLTPKEAAARRGRSTRWLRQMEIDGRIQRANRTGRPFYAASDGDAI